MNQPEFLTPLRNHTVEVGKNVTFECYVTGIEKYKVSNHCCSAFYQNNTLLENLKLCPKNQFSEKNDINCELEFSCQKLRFVAIFKQ